MGIETFALNHDLALVVYSMNGVCVRHNGTDITLPESERIHCQQFTYQGEKFSGYPIGLINVRHS